MEGFDGAVVLPGLVFVVVEGVVEGTVAGIVPVGEAGVMPGEAGMAGEVTGVAGAAPAGAAWLCAVARLSVATTVAARSDTDFMR
jgi:hypothetical protein